jgi:hypothetical protein
MISVAMPVFGPDETAGVDFAVDAGKKVMNIDREFKARAASAPAKPMPRTR